MQHEIDKHEEETVDPNRSRLMLPTALPLRRRLSLMPAAAAPAIAKEEVKSSKRRRKRSYSRVS